MREVLEYYLGSRTTHLYNCEIFRHYTVRGIDNVGFISDKVEAAFRVLRFPVERKSLLSRRRLQRFNGDVSLDEYLQVGISGLAADLPWGWWMQWKPRNSAIYGRGKPLLLRSHDHLQTLPVYKSLFPALN